MKLLKKIIRHFYKKLWKEEFYDKLRTIPIYDCYNKGFEYIWKEYFLNNNIKERTIQLCQNLSIEEQEFIKTIIFRHELFSNSIKFEDKYFINIDSLYTAKETQEQKTVRIYKKYKFPENFFETSVLYYHNGLKLLNNNCIDYLENKDFIDGGACIGDSACIFEKEYNPKNIYSFEPLKSNLSAINKTIELNSLTKVIAVPLGLGNKEEISTININNQDTGGSSILQTQDSCEQEKIEITTLDKYSKKHALDIGLIKLDVEGFEWNVIQGAIETIRAQRPILLISIYHTPKEFFEIKPFLESLNINYKFKIAKLEPNSIISEVMLLAYPQELD